MEQPVFPWRRPLLSEEEERFTCECILSVPVVDRLFRERQIQLDYPQVLMGMVWCLMDRWDSSPALVRDEAEFFYRLIEKKQKHDMGLLHERENCLGEYALIAGVACRFLSRREEARLWFDRAEMWFFYDTLSRASILRLAYQKLALRLEERQFAEVLSLTPPLIERMTALGMREEALKASLLEATVLKEAGRLSEAVERYRALLPEAETCCNGKLLGSAYVNLLQIHAFLGDAEKAFDLALEATPVLRRFDNRIDLAKLQLGLGYLQRKQCKISEAIDAYRIAQKEFGELGMRADIAAIQLVVADMLLDLGQQAQAEWEVRAALPIIEEYRLVPEGMAALSLLRESVRRRQIDQKALRDLHGYFPRQD